MAIVVNTKFIFSKEAAQALYEFITGNVMSKSSIGAEALATARFALNCQDPDIIVDMRKSTARVNNNLFDPFWAKMAVVVEGRVHDRRNGEYDLQLYKCCIYSQCCVAANINMASMNLL